MNDSKFLSKSTQAFSKSNTTHYFSLLTFSEQFSGNPRIGKKNDKTNSHFHSIHIAKDNLEKEHNIVTGRKNIVHCFRYLLFASQLYKHKKIVDYGAANEFWYQIRNQQVVDWQYYCNVYERLKREFEELVPDVFYNKDDTYKENLLSTWKASMQSPKLVFLDSIYRN